MQEEAVRWQRGPSVFQTWTKLRAQPSLLGSRTRSAAPWSRRSAKLTTWSMTWRWRSTWCAGWCSPMGRSTQTHSAAPTAPPWVCSPSMRSSLDTSLYASAVKSLCSYWCLLLLWCQPLYPSVLSFLHELNLNTLNLLYFFHNPRKAQECWHK